MCGVCIRLCIHYSIYLQAKGYAGLIAKLYCSKSKIIADLVVNGPFNNRMTFYHRHRHRCHSHHHNHSSVFYFTH